MRRQTFQKLSRELQHRTHFGRRFPLRVLQHAQAHGAGVGRRVIGDVWVVDFRREGDCWWLEGVVWWECDVECEVTALFWWLVSQSRDSGC